LIETELRKDASRSDREIARAVGCDHKTVAARRREMGIATPLGNPSAAGDVVGLIASTLAKNGLDSSDPTLFPILTAAANRDETKFDPYDPKEGCLIVTTQLAIACYINTQNCVVIRQEDPNDTDDDMIVIQRDHLPKVISTLRELQSELDDIIREEAAAS